MRLLVMLNQISIKVKNHLLPETKYRSTKSNTKKRIALHCIECSLISRIIVEFWLKQDQLRRIDSENLSSKAFVPTPLVHTVLHYLTFQQIPFGSDNPSVYCLLPPFQIASDIMSLHKFIRVPFCNAPSIPSPRT